MAYPYQKHVWVTKEIIRREYLQNIEDGIYDEQQDRLTQEDALNQSILDEEARAKRAELDLTNAVNAETTRATAAENSLSNAISAERTRATGVEADLNTAIAGVDTRVTDEITRAQSAESTLTSNLSAEVTRAQNAEGVLTTNLSSEITRAQGVEGTLTTNLAAEVTRAQGAESTLTTNLAAEVARAQGAESDLHDYIDEKVAAVYHPKGTIAFENLPALTVDYLNNVYNISNAFTTTADFKEGAGKAYPAGTNVAIINDGTEQSPSYKYDALAGFIDTSAFVTNTDYATTVKAGLVKPDGTTTAVDANGTLTVIGGGGGGDSTNFIGTVEQWEALTPEQKAEYRSKDITNDFNGYNIDSVPTENSTNVVTSGGVYSAISGVTSSSGNANKVWKKDANGIPGWRDEGSSGETITSKTLTAGATTVTFTGIPTSGNYLVEFYTSNGANYSAIDTSVSGQVTLTFEPQSVSITVYCVVKGV